MKNVIAFACIDKISKSFATVPWKINKVLSDGTMEEDVKHPLHSLLNRANPDQSWLALMQAAVTYYCLAGNAFLEKVSPAMGPNVGRPRELWTLRPDRIKIQLDEKTGLRTAYVYTYNGQEIVYPIDPITMNCDVLQIKSFHPLNEDWGFSPVEPAARKIDASNSADEWNKSLIDNAGRPGMLFFFKEGLTDEQYKRMQQAIREQIEGPKNSGKSHIIEGAGDVKPYGFSPVEMDWINSNKELARSICIVWGVSGQLIGIPDISTYSNYSEARAAFYEDTVSFYLALFKSELNKWLFKDRSHELCYVLDNVPAFQHKIDKKWERANNSNFLEINEKRALVGYEEKPYGDVLLQPAGLIPIEDLIFGPEDDDNEEANAKIIQLRKKHRLSVDLDNAM
jgi:HK97 family phage portal protein